MVYNIDYLEKLLTQYIMYYCKQGYNFYSKCSSGSQGEEMKIYLSNGKRILCVRIESNKRIDGFFYIDKQELVIEAFNNFDANILWNNKGEILNIYTFYVFDSKGKYKYIDDFEFAKEIEKKKRERMFRNRSLSSVFHFDYCSSKLYRFVKSKKGYKTVKPKDIYKVVHEYCNNGWNSRNYYIIYINEKSPIIFNFPIDK